MSIFQSISKAIVRLLGWKMTGVYPSQHKYVVIAVGPHTSNWDFIIGILIKSAYRLDVQYVGKHTLFRFPLGILMRWLGGIPVVRTSNNNFVSATAEALLKQERAHVAFSPEGTRSKVDKLRTGFYYLAEALDAPIQLVQFDWKNKVIHFGEMFLPTGNVEKDLAHIWDYFVPVQGFYPEKGLSPR